MIDENLFHKLHREMKDLMAIVEIKKGRSVYRADDWPTGIYFVHSGLVGLVIPTIHEHSEHFVRFFKPFDVFGFRSILSAERHHAEARALELCTLSFLPQKYFNLLLSTFPAFQHYLMVKLAEDLGYAEKSKTDWIELQACARVARGLVRLKEVSTEHKWKKSEIASYCGTTEATVIRCMSRFEDEGLIDQSQKPFQIKDIKKLLEAE